MLLSDCYCSLPYLSCLLNAQLTSYDRALVLYNAALAGAPAGQNPVLSVGQQQMRGFVHAPGQIAILALPGVDVEFVRGAITTAQIVSHRPSYINAILIQSRGQPANPGCLQCRNPRIGLRPFPECRAAPGHFGGACANCKWRDHGAACSLVRGDPGDDGGNDRGEPPRGGRRSRSPRGDDRTGTKRGLPGSKQGERRLLGAGSAGDPIVL